jgi:hypothetical protein
MNMSKILFFATFRRILVIFVVGLVLRSMVGMVSDTNVFKEFGNSISLGYYLFMTCFSVIVWEIPGINLKVFSPNHVLFSICLPIVLQTNLR